MLNIDWTPLIVTSISQIINIFLSRGISWQQNDEDNDETNLFCHFLSVPECEDTRGIRQND